MNFIFEREHPKNLYVSTFQTDTSVFVDVNYYFDAVDAYNHVVPIIKSSHLGQGVLYIYRVKNMNNIFTKLYEEDTDAIEFFSQNYNSIMNEGNCILIQTEYIV